MLRDEVKELSKKGYILEQRRGGCKFCGQITDIAVPPEWSESFCDEYATEICECREAYIYAEKKHRKEKAEKAVMEQFGEASNENIDGEVLELLLNIVEQVLEERVNSVTIDLGGGVKAKVLFTAKGNIKVEKTRTEKTTKET